MKSQWDRIILIESNALINQKFTEIVWHNRFGHAGSEMMQKMITVFCGLSLRTRKFYLKCDALSQEKLIIRSSPAKINILKWIQGDICGRIHPLCETFLHYMVLIDAYTR